MRWIFLQAQNWYVCLPKYSKMLVITRVTAPSLQNSCSGKKVKSSQQGDPKTSCQKNLKSILKDYFLEALWAVQVIFDRLGHFLAILDTLDQFRPLCTKGLVSQHTILSVTFLGHPVLGSNLVGSCPTIYPKMWGMGMQSKVGSQRFP